MNDLNTTSTPVNNGIQMDEPMNIEYENGKASQSIENSPVSSS